MVKTAAKKRGEWKGSAIFVAIFLAVCGLFFVVMPGNLYHLGPAKQAVDNTAAMKHVHSMLRSMDTPLEQMQYLAQMGCATDFAVVGVTDTTSDNALTGRWQELSRLYEQLRASDRNAPAGLAAAERRWYCPDLRPAGKAAAHKS